MGCSRMCVSISDDTVDCGRIGVRGSIGGSVRDRSAVWRSRVRGSAEPDSTEVGGENVGAAPPVRWSMAAAAAAADGLRSGCLASIAISSSASSLGTSSRLIGGTGSVRIRRSTVTGLSPGR